MMELMMIPLMIAGGFDGVEPMQQNSASPRLRVSQEEELVRAMQKVDRLAAELDASQRAAGAMPNRDAGFFKSTFVNFTAGPATGIGAVCMVDAGYFRVEHSGGEKLLKKRGIKVKEGK